MSNLVEHAKRELQAIGYTGEEPEDDINGMMYRHLMEMVEKFAEAGHSGMSGEYAVQALNKLLRFQNLKSLTDNPEEWIEVGPDLWQNNRNGECFSKDGGKTFTKLSTGDKVYTSEEHKA